MANTLINQIAAGVSSADAEEAYRRVQALNDAHVAKLRLEREKLRQDFQRYDAEDGAVAIRYQTETVDAQIKAWDRLRLERKAFGEEAKLLQAQINEAQRAGVDLETALGEKGTQKWREVLQARQTLFAEHQTRLDQAQIEAQKAEEARQETLEKAEKERAERRERLKNFGIGLAGAAGSALMRTSQGTEGERVGGEVAGAVGGAISGVASSKNTLDALLHVARGIFDVASSLYSLTLKRTQQVLSASTGTNQLLRFAENPGSRLQAERVLSEVTSGRTSRRFTPKEIEELPGTLGGIKRELPNFDISSQEQVTQALTKLGIVSTYVGKSMGELGPTLADYSRRQQTTFDSALTEIQRTAAAIDSLGDSTRLSRTKFVEDTLQVTEALRSLRFTIGDSARLVGKWASALQEGTLSLHQLVQMAQGHRTADTGTAAFLAPGMLAQLQKTAPAIAKALQGMSAVGQGFVLNQLRSGTEASRLYRQLGITSDSGEQKRLGIEVERALDVGLREHSRRVAGSDVGQQLFVQQQIYRTLGGKVGRRSEGLGSDVERTLIDEGLYSPTTKGALAVREETGKAPTLVGKETAKAIIEKTNSQVAEIKDATVGLWRRFTTTFMPELEDVLRRIRGTGVSSTPASSTSTAPVIPKTDDEILKELEEARQKRLRGE